MYRCKAVYAGVKTERDERLLSAVYSSLVIGDDGRNFMFHEEGLLCQRVTVGEWVGHTFPRTEVCAGVETVSDSERFILMCMSKCCRGGSYFAWVCAGVDSPDTDVGQKDRWEGTGTGVGVLLGSGIK